MNLQLGQRLSKVKRSLGLASVLPTVDQHNFVDPKLVLPGPILKHCCMPPFYYRSHDDWGTLMRIAGTVNPSLVLELGTAHGNTIANLAQLLPRCDFVTVNAPIEDQSGRVITYELSRRQIGVVYRESGFEQRVKQVYANTLSMDLSEHLVDPVDLAIVDACHDQEFVINDFKKCLPHMSKTGIVVFHDTHPSRMEHLNGSYDACLRLRKLGHDVRHVRGTWWGIWAADTKFFKTFA